MSVSHSILRRPRSSIISSRVKYDGLCRWCLGMEWDRTWSMFYSSRWVRTSSLVTMAYWFTRWSFCMKHYFWVWIIASGLILWLVACALWIWESARVWYRVRMWWWAVMMMWLPGYRLTQVFFTDAEIDALERHALSVALSISVIPLCVFYLQYMGVAVWPRLVRGVVTGIVLLCMFYLGRRRR